MTALISPGVIGDTSVGHTKAELAAELEDLRDYIAESILGAVAIQQLTIASGAITLPDGASGGGSIYTLETEAAAASDTLTTISLTNTHDGQVIILGAAYTAHVVTIDHAAGGTGQLQLWDGQDFTFASAAALVGFRRSGNDWIEIPALRFVPAADLTSVAALTSSDLVRVYDASASAEKSTPATQLGHIVQEVEATPYTTYNNVSAQIPADDTIPQNSEGVELVTATITPKSATNRLRIRASLSAAVGATGAVACALFQDSTANAIASRFLRAASDDVIQFEIEHEMAAGTTSAITFKLRAGPGAAALNLYVNGSTGSRLGGGTQAVRMRITEYAA